MKFTPTRAFLAVVALAAVLLLACTDATRRIHVGSTLIGTFFLFPLSDVNEMQVDETWLAALPSPLTHNTSHLAIPAHIHQVKLGRLEMRPTWTQARESCIALHPRWKFTLWQDAEADAFVKQHYPALFDTYRGYPLEIQRSNVLRYLLLAHFGGVYLDLDLACRVPLDGLRNETFITPPANPSGVNNAFIASIAHHPFWQHLVDNLPTYDLAWFGSPYVTNMMSTGCHFFSTMHRTFVGQAGMRILDQRNKLNGHVTTPLFEHLGASSWHRGDAKAILQLGRMVEEAKRRPVMASFAILVPTMALFAIVRWLQRRRRACRMAARRVTVAADMEARKGEVS